MSDNNTEAVLAAVKDYDLSKLPELVEACEAYVALDACYESERGNCPCTYCILTRTLNAVTRKG